MEQESGKIMSKILGKRDLDKVPVDILAKVEKFYDQRFEEFLTTKALYDIAQRNVDELQTKYDSLNTRSQDSDAKIESAQQNADELRQQLEISKAECRTLTESVQRLESDVLTFRQERNAAFDERDQLLKMSERQTINIERLQCDVNTLESQLQAAISAKCEAVVRCDEIEGREHSIEQREKYMEQDRNMLQAQIAQLRDSLNKAMNEMQTIRHENSVGRLQIETELAYKTEELKIAMSQVGQYAETNQELVNQTESLNVKLKEQNDEATKMMEHYQRELQAKDQLCDIYKASSADNEAEKGELTAAIGSLKKMLNEVTEEYGQMETKLRDIDVEHQKQLTAKDEIAQALRDELSNANDLLKIANEENVEHVLEKMTPTAAAASRRLKSGMTLTQIYNLYVKAVQDLHLKERECNQTEIQLKAILQELEERTPEWKRQKIEYQTVMASNEELNQQLDKLINERVNIRAEVAEASDKYSHMERENKQLKHSQADLARQVCYLLKEIEQMRGGFSTDQDQSISSDMSANEVISKKLVTFGDIVELQDNNQKLLLLVRDLSGRLEELEVQHASINLAAYEDQIAQFTKRFSEMEKMAEKQSKLSADCIKQKDRYKRLYFEIMSDVGKEPQSIEGSINNDAMDEDSPRSADPESGVTVNGSQSAAIDAKDKRIAELDEQLKDYVKQLKQLREEYVDYRKEKNANDKLTGEQFDQMRREVRELTSTNCNLMSSVTFHAEQIKIQQKNVAIYKKQIQALEERNRNYDKTIAKHEQTIVYLRDQTMQSQQRSSSAEIKCEELQRLSRKLQDDVSRLTIERDTLYRERHSQNLLQNNLELIKTTFERSENDGRIRMEQRFDEAQRECSALRRRLQEEQDHFRELAADLKRQTDTAIQKMNDEQAQGDGLRKQIEELRLDTEQKKSQLNQLSQKLQESLTPSKSDNPIATANKKIRELQLLVDQQSTELEQLRKEYNISQTMVEQLTKVSNEYENVSKEVQEQFDEFKANATAEIAALQLSETNLKSRIEEQDTEIRLQISGAQINTTDTTTELHKAQTELTETLRKVSENNRELRELRSECQLLKTSLQSVEQKYSSEMMLHSADIQALTQVKDEMNKIRDRLDALRAERDTSVAALNSYRNEWDNVAEQHSTEKHELEVRIKNLDLQNAALHDQLQALSNKIPASLNDSMNDSAMADSSLINRSITEDDVNTKSSDQLLTVIKYLRKEKDIAVSKVDILRAENVRLVTEAGILNKRLVEANEKSMPTDRAAASDITAVSAAKHDEILRKVETLNAITDSNRFLREERDSLSARVQELTTRITKLEDDLFPLQEKNRELLAKTEEQATENLSIRRAAEQWHKRATNLVERTNKNPEDFKRLQLERENLAKMLTAEKEALGVITEQLSALRNDKSRVDGELLALQRQHQQVVDEKKKLSDEFAAQRGQTMRMSQEIMELKNQVLIKEDELKKLVDALHVTETQLNDIKGKESKVRVIAKRYKDMYNELKNKSDAMEAEMAARPLADQVASAEIAAAAAQRLDAEQAASTRISELASQLAALEAELEKLRAENEALKNKDDTSLHLQEARARIKALTEAHAHITREFQSSKSQLQTCEQSRSEHDLLVAGLKSQCDGRINRLEKEMAELDSTNKETIARLTRENETLNHRVNQFHRQLQSQGSKPSTSSGPTEKGPSDAARTANVKPMAGPSGQQSAAVTPRRGGDTPLASIRPMSVQNSRTAAVLPTSQTSNVAALQGSSTGSVTALVPPQQQVHTTGQSSNSSAEAMSSSPTSSHTDYMPATSSAVVVAVPPMGSAASAAESSQEAESAPCSATINESHASSQAVVGQQQTVALVSPRIEVSPQSVAAVSAAAVQQQAAPQPSPQHQVSEHNQAAASTSGGTSSSSTSSSSVAMSTHHQASSSNTVTTTQAAGHKRPRDSDGDSSTGVEDSSASVSSDANKTSPKNKRTRLVEQQTFQGVSESGIDVEYQVPTSSQRDQEDDNVIVVDSEEEDEDDGMVDEGTAEQFEEESYDQEQDDEGEGPDIDEDNDDHRDTNEVEVDDSSDVPNQSAAAASASDVGTSGASGLEQQIEMATSPQNNTVETQQIQTISSGSEARPSTWGSGPSSGQNLILQQAFEETGDDSIVPSTPTLYGTRRTDGFSEAVSSPHPQVPQQLAARFSFNERDGSSSRAQPAIVPTAAGSSGQMEMMMDDTRVDLQLDQSVVDASRTPVSLIVSPQVVHQEVSPSTQRLGLSSDQNQSSAADAPIIEINLAFDAPDESSEPMDAVAGPSGSSNMTIDASLDPEDPNDSATTSEAAMNDSKEDNADDQGMDDEIGADGVTSEGEKVQNEEIQVEEGREAEASIQTPNTRSRSTPRNRGRVVRGSRGSSIDRTPITWHDSPQQDDSRQNDSGSPSIGSPSNRGRGGRRVRRPQSQRF